MPGLEQIEDVFACFANACSINTHQFRPPLSGFGPSRDRQTDAWNVLYLQSEAEVCLSLQREQQQKQQQQRGHAVHCLCLTVYVLVCAPVVCEPFGVCLSVRLVFFDDECVLFCPIPVVVVIIFVVAVNGARSSMLCCIAGALAFAYFVRPAELVGGQLENFVIDLKPAHRNGKSSVLIAATNFLFPSQTKLCLVVMLVICLFALWRRFAYLG